MEEASYSLSDSKQYNSNVVSVLIFICLVGIMNKFVIRKSRPVQESSPIETFDDSNPQNLSKQSLIDLQNFPSVNEAIIQRFQNMKSRRGQLISIVFFFYVRL